MLIATKALRFLFVKKKIQNVERYLSSPLLFAKPLLNTGNLRGSFFSISYFSKFFPRVVTLYITGHALLLKMSICLLKSFTCTTILIYYCTHQFPEAKILFIM